MLSRASGLLDILYDPIYSYLAIIVGLIFEQEEPYKMMLFGRSRHLLEVLAADFMPFEKQLHIIVADADMNLQVLQFDPDSTYSLLSYPLT
jgi:hypothetical protein